MDQKGLTKITNVIPRGCFELPYVPEPKWVPPGRDKRGDAQIGNTSVWSHVERAKNAGVSEVRGWRRDKSIASTADELRCHPSVNSIIESLSELIRERKRK